MDMSRYSRGSGRCSGLLAGATLASVVHLIGSVGGIVILIAYALASTRRIPVTGNAFQIMNLSGAVVLLAYSVVLVAWVSVGLNAVWGTVAAIALIRNHRASTAKAA